MGVKITITGGEELATRLLEIDERVNRPLAPLFQQIGGEWVTELQRIIREQDPPGGAWPALAPATQRLRKAQGYGPAGRMLQRRGDLMNHIGILSSDDTTLSVGVGADLEYAAIQQFGGTQPSTTRFPGAVIPARPFVALSEEVITDTLDNILAYLVPEPGVEASGAPRG